ncbi:MAG: hypothetical protein QNJ72_02585 [Pleurocapsa sp. MO_226.B13]|nr:hypothetical protein [Pleurocapsa sp. MO_226.B13]
MWKSKQELIDRDRLASRRHRLHKISIFKSERQLTYSEAIELWQQDSNFRSYFISLLAQAPMKAYFWETPPITRSTVNRAFEFVLLDSTQLAKVKPDASNFRQHFQSATQEVVTFSNLRKDALLIVPCPLTDTSAYPHLASFVENAPKSQQHLLWQTVGRELQHRLSHEPTWVSTSGLGVYWLHIRLDSIPKYYRFQPYKQEFD